MRHTFGGPDYLPPPRQRHPREELDPIGAALEAEFGTEELDELLRVASAAAQSTDGAGRPGGPWLALLGQISAAASAARVPDQSAPPPPRVGSQAFSVYSSDDPNAEPLPVLLGPPGAEELVTVVPAGRADWRTADPQTQVFPGDPPAETPAP
jgi:hypothetical protein